MSYQKASRRYIRRNRSETIRKSRQDIRFSLSLTNFTDKTFFRQIMVSEPDNHPRHKSLVLSCPSTLSPVRKHAIYDKSCEHTLHSVSKSIRRILSSLRMLKLWIIDATVTSVSGGKARNQRRRVWEVSVRCVEEPEKLDRRGKTIS